MLRVLKTLPEDTARVKLLNAMSFLYFTLDPDEGIRRGSESQALAEKLNWPKGLAGAYNSLGANYWAKFDYIQAQAMYWKYLRLTEQLKDQKATAKGYHNLGLIYQTQYNYSKALEYYGKSREGYHASGETWLEAGVLANLGAIHLMLNDTKSALGHYQHALQLMKISGSERDVAYMQGKIGSILTLRKEYGMAMDSLRKSLAVLQRYPDRADVANTHADIAEIYRNQNVYTQALMEYRTALRIADSVHSLRTEGLAAKFYYAIGSIYLRSLSDRAARSDIRESRADQMRQSAYHLRKAIDASLKTGDKENLRDAYLALSDLQSLAGQPSLAFANYRNYIRYQNSLENNNQERQMMRNELDYAYSKSRDSLEYQNKLQALELDRLTQETRIENLKRRELWLYTIIALAVLLITGGGFLYRYRTQQFRLKNELVREKAEQERKDTEYRRALSDLTFAALRSQMNPHFLFNTLNTIHGFIQTNDRKLAGHYLMMFSQMMRMILDHSRKQSISLREEIELTQMYLELEKARFGAQLDVTVEIDDQLSMDEIDIPPMLVQPYAENAVKHGLFHLAGEKRLNIRVQAADDAAYVDIFIDDNGIGRLQSEKINGSRTKHHSFANGANEKRIEILNRIQDRRIALDVIDKKNRDGSPSGTMVHLRIPHQSRVYANAASSLQNTLSNL
jgi:tetratricopeptide (TPR) repeat protein